MVADALEGARPSILQEEPMRTVASTIAITAIALGVAVSAARAATTNRTWVSHNGLAGNTAASPPCNAQQPCDTFANALTVTNAGGEINCLDNGSYGPVSIVQSVTIDCGGQLGTTDVTVDGTSGIIINGANAVVKLRNLTINGNGHSSGAAGILVTNAATVIVENCVIQNFSGTGSDAIVAATSNPLQLNVADTLIANNWLGIDIRVSSSGAVGFLVDRVRVETNGGGGYGLRADGLNGTGALTGFIRDSVVTGYATIGIFAVTSTNASPVTVSLDRTHVANNAVGITSQGGPAVILNNSTIQTNNTGLSASSGGAIFSYGNNAINGNQPNGSAAPILIGLH
jgi:hypothetical protein